MKLPIQFIKDSAENILFTKISKKIYKLLYVKTFELDTFKNKGKQIYGKF